MGSILSGWLESMLPVVHDEDSEIEVNAELFDKGLTRAVKDNDSRFPPEWRLSYAGRKQHK
jgi:hypothetical protein